MAEEKPRDYSLVFEKQLKNVEEEKFEIQKLNLPERADEDPQDIRSTFDKNGFRQFTDEELEHFIKFSKKENSSEADAKVEYLQTCLEELKNMMKELRLIDKDPYVAELMARALKSKIEFYDLSKDPEDYNKIIKQMKEIQKELEFCVDQKQVNFAQEVMKDLELQGVALKKSGANPKG